MMALVHELCPNGKEHAHMESGVLRTTPTEEDEGSDHGSRLVFRCYCACGIDGEACATEEEALAAWRTLCGTYVLINSLAEQYGQTSDAVAKGAISALPDDK